MERYSIIEEKFPREIVLLQGGPCIWGRCSFCDYILDNSQDMEAAGDLNSQVLARVTGKLGRLEAINSGSVFELPERTLGEIRDLADKKEIKDLVFEAHWAYRDRLDEVRDFFSGTGVFFKTGLETFDDDFRNRVLKKGIVYEDISEVSSCFDSVCLMVGVRGQTRDMVRKDIDLALENFERATVNIYHNNTTGIVQDPDLVAWFLEEFSWLQAEGRVEVLLNITDFGVG